MATPTIVQSAFVRGNTSPQTLTLSSPLTVGNYLVFIQVGWSQSLTPPAGLTQICYDVPAANQSVQSWYRIIQAGDGQSWAFTGLTDWHNIAVFEINGSASIIYNDSPASGSGTTSISVSLPTSSDSTELRLLALEWDNPTGISSVPAGWTLLSPTTWQNTSPTFHDGAIYSIPGSANGSQTITMLANTNNPVWLDLQISSSPPPLIVTQVGAETWANNSTTNYLRVTQVGAETWVDISTPYVPPVTNIFQPIIFIVT